MFRLTEFFVKQRLKQQLELDGSETGQVTLVSVCRNESLRLPYFFEYYKRLGVGRFIILDHQSSDDTAKIIDGEPLATRVPVAGNFIYKRSWISAVLEVACNDSWCLVVDADEFLVWPRMSLKTIPNLIASITAEDCDALPCVLLDMFPRTPIDEANYSAGDDPLDGSPWFYDDFSLRERFFDVGPNLNKVPLFRFSSRTEVMRGQHEVKGTIPSTTQGCLLHFKFLQDFRHKIHTNPLLKAVERQYGRELDCYQSKLDQNERLVLWSPLAKRYDGPEQLIRLGIMQEGEHEN